MGNLFICSEKMIQSIDQELWVFFFCCRILEKINNSSNFLVLFRLDTMQKSLIASEEENSSLSAMNDCLHKNSEKLKSKLEW